MLQTQANMKSALIHLEQDEVKKQQYWTDQNYILMRYDDLKQWFDTIKTILSLDYVFISFHSFDIRLKLTNFFCESNQIKFISNSHENYTFVKVPTGTFFTKHKYALSCFFSFLFLFCIHSWWRGETKQSAVKMWRFFVPPIYTTVHARNILILFFSLII